VALQLRKHGIVGVRPLLGGFYEWKKLGYPLMDVAGLETETPPLRPPMAATGSA
jgi:3-mercaptopyruvate sulfurtransferase SseA